MTKIFKETMHTYSYESAVSPFQKRDQQWDKPMGTWCAKAYFWRSLFFIFTSCAVLLSLILVLMSAKPPHTIYVAEVMPTGFIKNVTILKQKTIKI